MRMLIATAMLAAAVLAGSLGSLSGGALAQEGLACGGNPTCPDDYPLRLAPAAVSGTPLIWSRGHLVPPPPGREPVVLGRTIPLGEIIGRKVRPLGRPPEPVMYNKPLAELDPRDPSVMLLSLGPRERGAVLRRAD